MLLCREEERRKQRDCEEQRRCNRGSVCRQRNREEEGEEDGAEVVLERIEERMERGRCGCRQSNREDDLVVVRD